MRILMINTVYAVGSTGKIVKQLAEKAEHHGFECMIAHRYEDKKVYYPPNVVSISSWWDCHVHNRISRVSMLRGFFSKKKTLLFLKKVKEFKPDLIHLHNIHGNFINLGMLFRYIKKNRIKVVWTFHDCWPLTGNCKYFDMVECDKWKTGCGQCLQKGKSFIDISAFVYKHKQKLLKGIENMTIITPSVWLADLVRQSPLREYPIRVIHNGIDLNVFYPVNNNFKEEYGIVGKKMVLGVAFDWGKRKGLDVFIELASCLPDDYQIVLVGTNDFIDSILPKNIISIHKTNNQEELAAIYTAADIFVNTTREDNYPTVNMEALACGTPVVTFCTGGSPEMIDENCGCTVECDNVDLMVQQIINICENQLYSKEACLEKSKTHNMNDRFNEYIQLYEDLV